MFKRKETLKALRSEVLREIATIKHSIERAEVQRIKHQAAADFHANQASFYRANLEKAEQQLKEVGEAIPPEPARASLFAFSRRRITSNLIPQS